MEAARNASTPESQLHFLDYWRIIRIRKTVILAVFLLVFITTTVVTLILPESFSSTARIAVEKDVSDIPGLFERQTVSTYDPYFIQDQFEKIQSKHVLYQVIGELKLNDKWGQKYNSGTPLRTNETFMLLKRRLDVRQFRNTSVIEIRFLSEDKQEASDIANKISDVYKASRIAVREESSRGGIAMFQKNYTAQEKKVKELADKVYRLREELKVSDTIAEGGGPSMALSAETVRHMEQERISAETQLTIWQQKFNELTTTDRKELRDALQVVQFDQNLGSLMMNLAEAEQKLVVLSKDLTKDNPEYQKVRDMITTIDRQIDARVTGILKGIATSVAVYKQTSDLLAARLRDARDADSTNTVSYKPYFQARNELETEKQILNTMRFKMIQEEINLALPKQSIVEILDQAEPALRAVSPNVPLNIALGVIVGLLVGVGLAFFVEYLDTSVKTIDDVERALQAPVLGVIPQNVGYLIQEGADSPHAEAYRVLRTNVMFSRKKPDANSLTVVSGGAGEGKSTTIFNLATVFAQNGNRVLLVDSDLRRPSLHKILKVSNSIGLTNYLLRQNTLEQVVQTSKEPNLDFLPSGKLPSSSMGILNSAQMREFVRDAKTRYDFVFFDSPPIMGVSDASVLASLVDLAVLVVQYRKYPQAMTIRAKQMVEKVGGTMLGVVLNNINISQDSYYYYYSGYYYDYYSKRDDDEGKGGKPDATKNNGEKPESVAKRAGVDLKQKY